MAVRHPVYLEIGQKRVFAGAISWPGWCRSGKTQEAALAALVAYGDRYRAVTERAGVAYSPPAAVDELDIVERLDGGAGTDFGVPGKAPAVDGNELGASDLDRQVAILSAAWSAFDDAADAAVGVTLTTGPRGGGRSLEKIRAHVLEAEEAYLRALGSRPPNATGNRGEDAATLREATRAALRAAARGDPLPNPANTRRPWSPRYHLRRSTWHVLDHAWEIEDRSRR